MIPNQNARVVAPSDDNPQGQPIHLRNCDMIDRIDMGHTLATLSMNRLDGLLIGRQNGVNTSQVLNNLAGFMSTFSAMPRGGACKQVSADGGGNDYSSS